MSPIDPDDVAGRAERPPRRLIVRPLDDVADAVERETRRLLVGDDDRAIGLATGETFRDAYRLFEERATLDGVRGVMLDEYVGTGPGHPDGFAATLRRWLPGIGDRLDVLDGAAADPEAECARYERVIGASQPVDVQLLGIGVNGHIAFNEPGSRRSSRTRVVALTAGTRVRNQASLTALAAVPEQAMTQGVGTILGARAILVVATGRAKRPALARLIDGPAGADVPVSWLRLHPAVSVVADPAAAGIRVGFG